MILCVELISEEVQQYKAVQSSTKYRRRKRVDAVRDWTAIEQRRADQDVDSTCVS